MLRRLFSRRPRQGASANPAATTSEHSPAPRGARVEELESRTMFAVAPHFTSFTADNRGEVILNTQRSLNPATVTTASVFLFSVGTDGIPLTADDIKMPIRPTYTESNRQLRIRTIGLPANTTYFVKVSARLVKAFDGTKLDGEFNGPGVRTGNNVAGGDFLMISRRDKSNRPVARFYTNHGGVNVTLFKDLKPITVNNFLNYTNNFAAWDGTFFHRSVPGFVVQGGGFIVDRDNMIQDAHQEDSILNEPGITNTRGRISMARIDDNDPSTTDDINSATNQWFFNLGDNSDLDTVNGGFTAFGEVSDDASMAVIDAIAALDRVNAGGALNELPVNDLAAVQARGSLDPAADVVSVRRVAILNKNSALVV